MALPEILEFPFEAGCPKCRFVVTITEEDIQPGNVAMCPRCNVPLETKEAVTNQIIEESRH